MIYKLLGVTETEYKNTLKEKPHFRLEVKKAKERYHTNVKSSFIGQLYINKGLIDKSVNQTDHLSTRTLNRWRKKDEVFNSTIDHVREIFNHPKPVSKPKTDKHHPTYYVGKELREIFCPSCNRSKKVSSFHRDKSKDTGYSKICIKCTNFNRFKRLSHRRKSFDFEHNRYNKIFNELGHFTQKRCTKCNQVKGKEDFPFLNRSIPVCEDCFDINKVRFPPKRVEFFKRGGVEIQIREYNGDYPVAKRCSLCGIMRDLDDFSRDLSNHLDGKSSQCRICTRKKRLSNKNEPT